MDICGSGCDAETSSDARLAQPMPLLCIAAPAGVGFPATSALPRLPPRASVEAGSTYEFLRAGSAA